MVSNDTWDEVDPKHDCDIALSTQVEVLNKSNPSMIGSVQQD